MARQSHLEIKIIIPLQQLCGCHFPAPLSSCSYTTCVELRDSLPRYLGFSNERSVQGKSLYESIVCFKLHSSNDYSASSSMRNLNFDHFNQNNWNWGIDTIGIKMCNFGKIFSL